MFGLILVDGFGSVKRYIWICSANWYVSLLFNYCQIQVWQSFQGVDLLFVVMVIMLLISSKSFGRLVNNWFVSVVHFYLFCSLAWNAKVHNKGAECVFELWLWLVWEWFAAACACNLACFWNIASMALDDLFWLMIIWYTHTNEGNACVIIRTGNTCRQFVRHGFLKLETIQFENSLFLNSIMCVSSSFRFGLDTCRCLRSYSMLV